jgi:hypothetical protein
LGSNLDRKMSLYVLSFFKADFFFWKKIHKFLFIFRILKACIYLPLQFKEAEKSSIQSELEISKEIDAKKEN